MDYRSILPILDESVESKYHLNACRSPDQFLQKVIEIYFSESDLRMKEACLSVYMAFRDHYPSYLAKLSPAQLQALNDALKITNGKIIKLRRIVLSQLCKVA